MPRWFPPASVVAVPAVAVGWAAGDVAFRHLEERQIRVGVSILLATTVLLLVARAVLS